MRYALTTPQAAERLGISERTLRYRVADSLELRIKIPRRLRGPRSFRWAEDDDVLDAWLVEVCECLRCDVDAGASGSTDRTTAGSSGTTSPADSGKPPSARRKRRDVERSRSPSSSTEGKTGGLAAFARGLTSQS